MTDQPAQYRPGQLSPDGRYRLDSNNQWQPVEQQWTPPTGPGNNPPYAGASPAKKKHRIFPWVFLAIQLLFIIWIVTGIAGSAGDVTDCGSLDKQTCADASNVGTGIGVFLIVVLWMIVDFFLAVGYLIFRLARR